MKKILFSSFLALQGAALNIRDTVNDTENCVIRMKVFETAWDMYGNDIQIQYEQDHRDDLQAIWPYQKINTSGAAKGEKTYFAHQDHVDCFRHNICDLMTEAIFQKWICDAEDMTKEAATVEYLQKSLHKCCDPATECCPGDTYHTNQNCPCNSERECCNLWGEEDDMAKRPWNTNCPCNPEVECCPDVGSCPCCDSATQCCTCRGDTWETNKNCQCDAATMCCYLEGDDKLTQTWRESSNCPCPGPNDPVDSDGQHTVCCPNEDWGVNKYCKCSDCEFCCPDEFGNDKTWPEFLQCPCNSKTDCCPAQPHLGIFVADTEESNPEHCCKSVVDGEYVKCCRQDHIDVQNGNPFCCKHDPDNGVCCDDEGNHTDCLPCCDSALECCPRDYFPRNQNCKCNSRRYCCKAQPNIDPRWATFVDDEYPLNKNCPIGYCDPLDPNPPAHCTPDVCETDPNGQECCDKICDSTKQCCTCRGDTCMNNSHCTGDCQTCRAEIMIPSTEIPSINYAFTFAGIHDTPYIFNGDLEHGTRTASASEQPNEYVRTGEVDISPDFFKTSHEIQIMDKTNIVVLFDQKFKFQGLHFKKTVNIKEIQVFVWAEATSTTDARFVYFGSHLFDVNADRVVPNDIIYSTSRLWFVVLPEDVTNGQMSIGGIVATECGCDHAIDCCAPKYNWRTNSNCICDPLQDCCPNNVYPENINCPCDPAQFCCPQQTSYDNPLHCCDSDIECCPQKGDVYPQNPKCTCYSATHCCPNDDWRSNLNCHCKSDVECCKSSDFDQTGEKRYFDDWKNNNLCPCDFHTDCCNENLKETGVALHSPPLADMYPENQNCECISETHCCPGDTWVNNSLCRCDPQIDCCNNKFATVLHQPPLTQTWKTNSIQCQCDSNKECCNDEFLATGQPPVGRNEDWGTNPDHCPCKSADYCCPNDTWTSNPVHCTCNPVTECCDEDDWKTNANCSCDSASECCHEKFVNAPFGHNPPLIDTWLINVNCECNSADVCCNEGNKPVGSLEHQPALVDTWIENAHCPCDSNLNCCTDKAVNEGVFHIPKLVDNWHSNILCPCDSVKECCNSNFADTGLEGIYFDTWKINVNCPCDSDDECCNSKYSDVMHVPLYIDTWMENANCKCDSDTTCCNDKYTIDGVEHAPALIDTCVSNTDNCECDSSLCCCKDDSHITNPDHCPCDSTEHCCLAGTLRVDGITIRSEDDTFTTNQEFCNCEDSDFVCCPGDTWKEDIVHCPSCQVATPEECCPANSHHGLEADTHVTKPDFCKCDPLKECCPAQSAFGTVQQTYIENPKFCPCDSLTECCPAIPERQRVADTFATNPIHCKCDPLKECCEAQSAFGTVQQTYETNPKFCKCDSLTECCPAIPEQDLAADTYITNPTHCKCDSQKVCCPPQPHHSLLQETYKTNPTYCPCHSALECCPAIPEQDRAADTYDENPHWCPCKKEVQCCPDHTWEMNPKFCTCDSRYQCCPAGTLDIDEVTRREEDDVFAMNPNCPCYDSVDCCDPMDLWRDNNNCVCNSSRECCPGDDPCAPLCHTTTDGLCCPGESFLSNDNCCCDSNTVCCKEGTKKCDDQKDRIIDDSYPSNLICPCDSADQCCDTLPYTDNYMTNPTHCLCDDCNECCPGDTWKSNPTFCKCNSQDECCPGDTHLFNNKCICDSKDHCCLAGTFITDNLRREEKDTYPTNQNCPCDSSKQCCDQAPYNEDCFSNDLCSPKQGQCCPTMKWPTPPCPCDPTVDTNKCCPDGTRFSSITDSCCRKGDPTCCDKNNDDECMLCECKYYLEFDVSYNSCCETHYSAFVDCTTYEHRGCKNECPSPKYEVPLTTGGTTCCEPGDQTCCDPKLDPQCSPPKCSECDIRRQWMHSMLSYVDNIYNAIYPDVFDDYQTVTNDVGEQTPWMQDPQPGMDYNWLDVQICKVSEQRANQFLECLNNHDDEQIYDNDPLADGVYYTCLPLIQDQSGVVFDDSDLDYSI